MNEERSKILEMLAEGKITVADASRLLDAVGDATSASAEPVAISKKPKYLKVMVKDKGDNVNIRVPLQLLRAGVSLATLLPKQVGPQVSGALKEKGINFDFTQLKGESLEELVQAIEDLSVNVSDKDGATVKICCE